MNTTLTVDKAGRIVLPKPLRDKLQLVAGDSLELENAGEEIVLRPVRGIAKMRKRDGIWVFNTGSPVSSESVDEAIRQMREERDEQTLHPEGARGQAHDQSKGRKR